MRARRRPGAPVHVVYVVEVAHENCMQVVLVATSLQCSEIAKQSPELSTKQDIKEPCLGWMIAFVTVVSFLGLFSVLPLRKIMIVDFKLTYPSGTATAHLINSFHTTEGAKVARKQVHVLGKFFSFSFLWGFFQWFYTASDGCGFKSFPTFGLEAYENQFFFDFSTTYVGVGMICPYIINVSLLLGGISSWAIIWPLIDDKKGVWYSAGLKQSSLHGLQGYKVFIAIAMILGDGLYNFIKVLGRTFIGLYNQFSKQNLDTSSNSPSSLSYVDQCRIDTFLRDQIPAWFAISGYVIIAIISIVVPHIFQQLKWYYIVVIYVIAPALAFCNAYGCGLTDWSLASTYGKLAIFTIGAWAGAAHGGVLSGLSACGVMMNIVSTASDLMQDFKTGYVTLASPRSMFVSQVFGTIIGCIISPCVFWLFYKAFGNLGIPCSEYPAPYAIVYRNMSILGVDGFSSLPKYCLVLCCAFFIAAIVINLVRDLVGEKWAKFIPVPMAMAIPFYIGSYFAIDMSEATYLHEIFVQKGKHKGGWILRILRDLVCIFSNPNPCHSPSTTKLHPSKLLTATTPPTTAATPPSPSSASPARAQPRTTAGGSFDQHLRVRPTRSPAPPTTAATPPPPSSASPSRAQRKPETTFTGGGRQKIEALFNYGNGE
ncbi:hypothetical protein Fmac_014355 [Flemingia macrophylla]|uniref:Metal-nicotianamine transporter YSL7 n=1 Tax=Flemingia macrophylla TaxID=520843 RepID=A0ABD1MBL0_9FABA